MIFATPTIAVNIYIFTKIGSRVTCNCPTPSGPEGSSGKQELV